MSQQQATVSAKYCMYWHLITYNVMSILYNRLTWELIPSIKANIGYSIYCLTLGIFTGYTNISECNRVEIFRQHGQSTFTECRYFIRNRNISLVEFFSSHWNFKGQCSSFTIMPTYNGYSISIGKKYWLFRKYRHNIFSQYHHRGNLFSLEAI